jgi:hypothetical protein
MKSPPCPTSQQCYENENGEAYCKCKDEYVDISTNNKTITCEIFEPCNKDHRKLKPDLKNALSPCGNPNITCIPLGGDKYTCVCPPNFKRINGEKINAKK